MHEKVEHITLSQAAKISPGRPSANCIWRWCRRGVVSRSGERVRLEHVRIGGKIYTTADWLEQFGKRLAQADCEYFELTDPVAAAADHHIKHRARSNNQREAAIAQAEAQLREAGV